MRSRLRHGLARFFLWPLAFALALAALLVVVLVWLNVLWPVIEALKN